MRVLRELRRTGALAAECALSGSAADHVRAGADSTAGETVVQPGLPSVERPIGGRVPRGPGHPSAGKGQRSLATYAVVARPTTVSPDQATVPCKKGKVTRDSTMHEGWSQLELSLL